MSAWRPRFRLVLARAGMTGTTAILASAALVAFLAIACQGGEEARPVPRATVAPSPTGAAPSPAPEVQPQPRLIFLRPQSEADYVWHRLGVIHVSDDVAGSNVIQLTPADVRASFVGLSERSGKAILYYFAAGETSNVFTLEARDLGTGKTTTLASMEPATLAAISPTMAFPPSGSLSPGGRYVAFTDRDGLGLLDLTTNGRQTIIPGRREACESGTASECWGFAAPTWSPDGRLLLVQVQGWEPPGVSVVDPFQQPALGGGPRFNHGAWSPAGDALCGWGAFDQPSGLCLSQAPEWRDDRSLVPENETRCDSVDVPGHGVAGCVWLDEHRIAFVTVTMEIKDIGGSRVAQTVGSGVSVYDLETAAVTDVADFGAASPELFPVPGTGTLVFNDRAGGQPGLLDTTDGTRTPILQAGDLVVAVTQPIALPEEVVAAEPEVRPCTPLTAGCEAQVTNVAPEQVNMRKGASQGTDVTGSLSEGEIVCLTGFSQLGGGGLRWWPVRSRSGVEGWVAHGDPQEPERPWLTPTGRKCESPGEPPHA